MISLAPERNPAARDGQDVRASLTVDRRRPARVETTNPDLILLMRGAVPPPVILPEDVDDGSPLLGIAMAVLLSIPFWLMLAFLCWTIF